MTRLAKASALVLTVLPLASTLQYQLVKEYNSTNLFDEFNFLDGSDPTGGFVRYVPYDVAAASQLISNATDIAYIGVDTTKVYSPGEVGRTSVRLGSKATYTQGLFVIDLTHLPVGCGTWPAFWTTDLDNWPAHGEIDIIEGVNDARNNNAALHTLNQCDVDETTNQTGIWKSTECSSVHDEKQGCSTGLAEPNNYGPDFNQNGGGVYAMEWTSDAIRIWFFPPTGVPTGLTDGGIPDTASFGVPSASFSGPCSSSFETAFVNHSIVIDTTFCGSWAGNVFGSGSSSCPLTPGVDSLQSCVDYVANNPTAFQEAYWGIRSVKVWQKAPALAVPGLPTPSAEPISEALVPSAAEPSAVTQILEPSSISPLTGGILVDESQEAGPVELPNVNPIAIPSTLLTAASAFETFNPDILPDVVPIVSNTLDYAPETLIPLPATETVPVDDIPSPESSILLPTTETIPVYDIPSIPDIPDTPLPVANNPAAANPFVNALGTNPFNNPLAANPLGTAFGTNSLGNTFGSNALKNGAPYVPPYGNRRFWTTNHQESQLLADDPLGVRYLSDQHTEAEVDGHGPGAIQVGLNIQFPPLARSPQVPPPSEPPQASPISNTNAVSPAVNANAAAPIGAAIPAPVAQAESAVPIINPDLSASIVAINPSTSLVVANLPATIADASAVVPIASADVAPAIINVVSAPAIVNASLAPAINVVPTPAVVNASLPAIAIPNPVPAIVIPSPVPAIVIPSPAPAIVNANSVAPVAASNVYPPIGNTVPAPPTVNDDGTPDTFCSADSTLMDKILSIAHHLPSPLPKASSVVALNPPNGPGAALLAAAPTPLNVPVVPSLPAPAVDIPSQPAVPVVVPNPPALPVIPLLNLTAPKKGGSLLKFLDSKTKDTLTSVLADVVNSTDSNPVKRHPMALAAPGDESDPAAIPGAAQDLLDDSAVSTPAVVEESENALPEPVAAATPNLPIDASVSISNPAQDPPNGVPAPVLNAVQGPAAPISPPVQDLSPVGIQAATPGSNIPIPAVVPDVPIQLPAAFQDPVIASVPAAAQNYPVPIVPVGQTFEPAPVLAPAQGLGAAPVPPAVQDSTIPNLAVAQGPLSGGSATGSSGSISPQDIQSLLNLFGAPKPPSNPVPQTPSVSPQVPNTIPQAGNVLPQLANAPKAPPVVVLPQTANANPVSLEPVVKVTALNSTDTKVAMAGLLSFLDDDTKAQLVDSLVAEDDSTETARQGNVLNADSPVDDPLRDPLGKGIDHPQLDNLFGTVPAPQATNLVTRQGGDSVDDPLRDPLGKGIDHPQLDNFAGSAPTSRETWGEESALLSDDTKGKLDDIIRKVAGLSAAGFAGLSGSLNDILASGEILPLRTAINSISENDKTELGKFLTGDENLQDAANTLDGLFLQGLTNGASSYAGTMYKIVGASKSFAAMPNEGTRGAFWDTVKDGVSAVYAETHPDSDPNRAINARQDLTAVATAVSPWTFMDKIALAQNVYGLCPTPYFAGIYFPSSTSLAFDLLDPKQTLEAALSTYQRRLQAYYEVAVQGCWTRISQWLAWRQMTQKPGAMNIVAFPQPPLPLLKRQESEGDDGSADPKGLVEQQIYAICPKPDTFSADSLIVDLEDPTTTLEVAIGKFQNKLWAYMAKLQSCSDQIRKIGPKLKNIVDGTPAPEPIFHTNGAVNLPGAADLPIKPVKPTVSKPSSVPKPASRKQIESFGDIPAEAILEPLALKSTGQHYKDLPVDQQDILYNALLAGFRKELSSVTDTATKAVSSLASPASSIASQASSIASQASSLAPKASSIFPRPSSIIALPPFDPTLSKRSAHDKRQKSSSSSSVTNSPLDNGIIPDKDTPEDLDEILGKHGTLDPFGMLVDDNSSDDDDSPHYNDHSRPFQGDDEYTYDLPSSSVDKADPDVDEVVDELGELDPFGQLGPRVKPSKDSKSDPEDEKDKVLNKLNSNQYFGKLKGYECGGKGRKYNMADVRDEEEFINKYYHGSARHQKNRYWRERQHMA